MPSFLHQVLTAHELDELGLNEAVRVADFQAPKALHLGSFLRTRSLIISLAVLDCLVIPFLCISHYREWSWNAQRSFSLKLMEAMHANGSATTLLAALTYSVITLCVEITGGLPLRHQAPLEREQPRRLQDPEIRVSIEPWDIASCWNSLCSKVQVVLDIVFCLECYRNGRYILSLCAAVIIVAFLIIPRLCLVTYLSCLLFQPTPYRFSLTDQIGAIFGFKASRRHARPRTLMNIENLKRVVCPARSSEDVKSPALKRPLISEASMHDRVVDRNVIMVVSYPSTTYALIRAICRMRWLTKRSLKLARSISLTRAWLWVRSSRDVVCVSSEDTTPPFEALAEDGAKLATNSPLHEVTSSSVEVEMEMRNKQTLPDRPRRSRGITPGSAGHWTVPPDTLEEGSSTPPPLPEEEEIPTLPEDEPVTTTTGSRGWMRFFIGSPEDSDFYSSILSAMDDIEQAAIAEDSKILELTSLAATSESFFLHDTLKEEYLAPDFVEEAEFLSTLLLFVRIHILNLILNLLRFHCLMSSMSDSVDWFVLTGLLASLVQGVSAFFYASFDQAVIDELMDDD